MKIIKYILILGTISAMIFMLNQEANAETIIDQTENFINKCGVRDLNFNFAEQILSFDATHELDYANVYPHVQNYNNEIAPLDIYFTEGESNILAEFHIDMFDVPQNGTALPLDLSGITVDDSTYYKIYFFTEYTVKQNWYSVFWDDSTYESNLNCYLGGDPNDEGDINIQLFGIDQQQIVWKPWFIETAFASNCTYVTNGATTTAECTDPIIQNTTQDVATGLILFFTMFFGIIFYFRKGVR